MSSRKVQLFGHVTLHLDEPAGFFWRGAFPAGHAVLTGFCLFGEKITADRFPVRTGIVLTLDQEAGTDVFTFDTIESLETSLTADHLCACGAAVFVFEGTMRYSGFVLHAQPACAAFGTLPTEEFLAKMTSAGSVNN